MGTGRDDATEGQVGLASSVKRRPVLPLSGLVVAVAVIATAFWAWQNLDLRRQNASATAANLALALEKYLDGTLREIDLTLLAAADEFRHLDAGGDVEKMAFTPFLENHEKRLPQVVSLRATDALGQVRHGGGVNPDKPVSLSDRDFFVGARDQIEAGLVLGAPVFARISQRWVLPVSRRLERRDGTFAGVAYANIALQHFTDTFASLETGPRGAVSLFGADRGIIARHPEPKGVGSTIGVKLSSPQFLALWQAGRAAATYRARSAADGIERSWAYRKVGAHPLHVIVGLAEDDYLAPWRQEVILGGGGVALFGLITMALAMLVHRSWRQRDAAAAAHAAALFESREEAERARRRSDLILQSVGDGICGIDANGLITFINPAARRMFGFAATEGAGLPLHAATHHHRADGAEYPIAECPSHQTLLDGESRHIEEDIFWRRDGSTFPVEFTTAALVEGTARSGAVIVFRDISKRKEAEEALRCSNADLAQFAYAVSHDLQEPLRMVSNYVQMVQRRYVQNLDPEAHEFMNFAVDGAKRMQVMIRDLLDYSRVTTKGGEVGSESLAEMVSDALGNLAAAIDESDARITHGPLPVVACDRAQIVRLLQNLIGNAIKYRSRDRRPEIHIEAARVNGDWRISIRDNGIGIASEHYERVFQVFQRLHGRGEYEGTGIGLALCKKIVERHGGRIWVDSVPGEGSTFSFSLPTPRA